MRGETGGQCHGCELALMLGLQGIEVIELSRLLGHVIL
jgi:hypothetical protein